MARDHDLSHYDWDHPVVQPRSMSIEELRDGVAWAYKALDGSMLQWLRRQLTSNPWVIKRSPRLASYLLANTFYQPYRVDY